jgi:hypothetical protein
MMAALLIAAVITAVFAVLALAEKVYERLGGDHE